MDIGFNLPSNWYTLNCGTSIHTYGYKIVGFDRMVPRVQGLRR